MKSRHDWTSMAPLRAMLRIDTDNPGLMRSQLKALSRQVPLLYLIVLTNTLALAYTHYDVAPAALTLSFPAIIAVVLLARARAWLKAGGQPMSDVAVARLLRTTVVLGPAIAAVIFVWAILLYQYGDAYAQGHVAFY